MKEEGKEGLYMWAGIKDMDARVADLKAKGVELTRGPFGEEAGPRIAFFDSPDGVKIRIN